MHSQASHAEPSTMPAMVEVGTIPALLKHLASKPFSPPSDKCPRGKGDAFVRRQAGGVEQEESGESPSFLLAARLLYAFSSDPDGRCVCARSSRLEGRGVAHGRLFLKCDMHHIKGFKNEVKRCSTSSTNVEV